MSELEELVARRDERMKYIEGLIDPDGHWEGAKYALPSEIEALNAEIAEIEARIEQLQGTSAGDGGESPT